jgi:hypothetical protein
MRDLVDSDYFLRGLSTLHLKFTAPATQPATG